MDGVIREIYNSVVQKYGRKGRLSKGIEEEILNLLDGMEKLDRQECEEYRENMYFIAYKADEDGFVKGFQYASWLFAECMRDGCVQGNESYFNKGNNV